MRQSHVRKGRQCIYPEVSRTKTFGDKGTSEGEFFKEYFEPMVLNKLVIDWDNLELGYLTSASIYDKYVSSILANATRCRVQELLSNNTIPDGGVVVHYADEQSYLNIARQLPHMLPHIHEHLIRCSYKGHVLMRFKGRRLILSKI